MRKLVIILIVILGVLLVVDRVGVNIAEGAVAQTMQESQHLQAEPDVDIAGFPFLTQLVSRDFDEITITAKNIPLGNKQVHVTARTVTAVMKDVKVAGNLHSVTIGHGDAV